MWPFTAVALSQQVINAARLHLCISFTSPWESHNICFHPAALPCSGGSTGGGRGGRSPPRLGPKKNFIARPNKLWIRPCCRGIGRSHHRPRHAALYRTTSEILINCLGCQLQKYTSSAKHDTPSPPPATSTIIYSTKKYDNVTHIRIL